MKKYKVIIEPLTIHAKFIDIVSEGPAGMMRVKTLDSNFIMMKKNKLQQDEAKSMKGKWGFFGCEVRNNTKWFVKFVPITPEIQTMLEEEYKANLAKKDQITS